MNEETRKILSDFNDFSKSTSLIFVLVIGCSGMEVANSNL
jgi:hypothetical protein